MDSFLVKKIVCKYGKMILYGYYKNDSSNKIHKILYAEFFAAFWKEILGKKYVIIVNKANRKWNYITDILQDSNATDDIHSCDIFNAMVQDYIVGKKYQNDRYIILLKDGSLYRKYKCLPFFTRFNLFDAHCFNKHIQGSEVILVKSPYLC